MSGLIFENDEQNSSLGNASDAQDGEQTKAVPPPPLTNRSMSVEAMECQLKSPTKIEFTPIVLDHIDASNDFNSEYLKNMSFLLCVFDNIVGPRIVHHWFVKANKPQQSSVKMLDDQMLKYIAVHTLNGQLYQDKLSNNIRYRLYLIEEVDKAIFTVFFDASTIGTTNSSYNAIRSCADLIDSNEASGDGAPNIKKHFNSFSNKSKEEVTTTLNSLSIILPLKFKDVFLKFYGENTRFFTSALENIVIEYKIYAHIKPKVS